MVILDLFGIHASGKTTTIRALESYCDVELPIADNEKNPMSSAIFLSYERYRRWCFEIQYSQ